MKNLQNLVLLSMISFFVNSCVNKIENEYPYPCVGNCSTNYKVVYLGDTLTQNQNGIWEIEYAGLNYFQVLVYNANKSMLNWYNSFNFVYLHVIHEKR